MSKERKVFVFIAMSLDGFIATNSGNIDFLNSVEMEGEDYGYNNFINQIDTVVLGRKTYEKVMSFGIGFPHADKKTYVLSGTTKKVDTGIIFYKGEVGKLVRKIKEEEGLGIFVDGGADVINQFLKEQMINEFIISIIPCFLGSGIRLFDNLNPAANLTLLESKSYTTGLVKLHYSRKVKSGIN